MGYISPGMTPRETFFDELARQLKAYISANPEEYPLGFEDTYVRMVRSLNKTDVWINPPILSTCRRLGIPPNPGNIYNYLTQYDNNIPK